MPRPLIGVTGPDRGGLAAWLFTAHAVRRAGGKPRRIRPARSCPIDRLDGLIIGGGADVGPALYGQTRQLRMRELADRERAGFKRMLGYLIYPLLWLVRRLLTKKQGGLDPGRDRLESALIEAALARGLPLLGICRGMQMINVARGGSLHQSLEGFYDEYPAIRSVLPRKRIEIAPGSRLHALLGARRLRVNALHNQAIDELGHGLKATAREPNGVLQAYEGDGPDWLIGVQWHPEYLPQYAAQRALFEGLVDQARTRVEAGRA